MGRTSKQKPVALKATQKPPSECAAAATTLERSGAAHSPRDPPSPAGTAAATTSAAGVGALDEYDGGRGAHVGASTAGAGIGASMRMFPTCCAGRVTMEVSAASADPPTFTVNQGTGCTGITTSNTIDTSSSGIGILITGPSFLSHFHS